MNPTTHNTVDTEIEHDVAELRAMVESIGEKLTEPHPAYWQNFPLRLRERMEHGAPKKRTIKSIIWAPAIGVAVVIVITMGTIFWPKGNSDIRSDSTSKSVATASPNGHLDDPSSHLYNDQQQSSSLVLSKGEVKMLDAIMSDDDNALFNAVVDNQ